MQEKTLEELLEDFAGIAVNYWRATGTSDEHKKDTEDMQEIVSIISSREEKAREEGRKEGVQASIDAVDLILNQGYKQQVFQDIRSSLTGLLKK